MPKPKKRTVGSTLRKKGQLRPESKRIQSSKNAALIYNADLDEGYCFKTFSLRLMKSNILRCHSFANTYRSLRGEVWILDNDSIR